MQNILTSKQANLNELDNRLQQNNPAKVIVLHQQKIEELKRKLFQTGSRIIHEKKQSLNRAAGVLDAVSPLSTLARGYSIARRKTAQKPVITSVGQVREGEEIEIILHQGKLKCSVLTATEQP